MSPRKDQNAGREANGALPLGHRTGGDTDGKVKAQGKREQRSAGPDGPDAREVGDTFKRGPG
jgi:hypothetical protein